MNDVVWGVLGACVASLISLLTYDLCIVRKQLSLEAIGTDRERELSLVSGQTRTSRIRQLVRTSIPLGLLLLLGSLTVNVPRYFIQHFSGESELAIFAAIGYLIVAGNLVINALGQSATPRLARLFAQRKYQEFRDLSMSLVKLGAGVGIFGVIGAFVAGPQFLRQFYGPEYSNNSRIVLLLMISAAIGYFYVFLGTTLSSMRCFNVQLPIHVGTLILLVLLCAVLVPRFGATGAASSMIVASIVECIAYVVVIRTRIFTSIEEMGSDA